MKKVFFYLFLCLVFFGNLSCDEKVANKSVSSQSSENVQLYETSSSEASAPVFHVSHEPKKQNAPFSDVVQVGNILFLSGQIGMDHSVRELVSGGIKPETIQALENIKAVLAQHELSMNDVVKATIILDDIEDFSVFNEIYTTYFPKKPARTTFAAEALAKGAKIEIEVVAVFSER